MKKKALNKTLKESLLIFLVCFVFLFFQLKACGPGIGIKPSSAPYKSYSISWKETMESIDYIIYLSLGGSIIYFIMGYGYNKGKMEKEAKRKEEELSESESGNKEEDDTLPDE